MMKTMYKPRWRNVIKGVRLAYDKKLGGGNIIAWGLGSEFKNADNYVDPADRVAAGSSYTPPTYVNPDEATSPVYVDPFAIGYTPPVSTQPTNYAEVVAAENAAKLAEYNAQAVITAQANTAEAEAKAAETARQLAISNAKLYADQAAAEEAARALYAAQQMYLSEQANANATAAQIANAKMQAENAAAMAAATELAYQQKLANDAILAQYAQMAADQLAANKANLVAAQEAAAAAARLAAVTADKNSTQAEIDAAKRGAETATNKANLTAATVQGASLFSAGSPTPMYLAGAVAVLGILALIFKK